MYPMACNGLDGLATRAVLLRLARSGRLQPGWVDEFSCGQYQIFNAALFCAAHGIDGPNGTVPVWLNIPQCHVQTVLGLVVHFPDNREASFVVLLCRA